MTTVVNHALRQLRAGKLAIGIGLRQARTVDTAQLMKTAPPTIIATMTHILTPLTPRYLRLMSSAIRIRLRRR